jgi:acyl-CoA synthetase (AMP-forming)/AMP-acid ligase II
MSMRWLIPTSYKLPHLVYLVDELPLAGSGKVRERILREGCCAL